MPVDRCSHMILMATALHQARILLLNPGFELLDPDILLLNPGFELLDPGIPLLDHGILLLDPGFELLYGFSLSLMRFLKDFECDFHRAQTIH